MSSAGNRGVTLIEMVVVVAIIGLIVGVTLPAATSGLSSLRLRGASGDVVSFVNSALNRAERREEVMEIIVYPRERKLELASTEPGYSRTLEMPQDVNIAGENPVRILLMPGSAPPRITIDLYNEKGAHRVVRLDPVTGVPRVTVAQEGAQ
jgi:prepilin-type N-terminal cleavage/methylation domain-containing protein